MSDIYTRSIELHEKNRGKLTLASKIKLDNKEDLALAYSPGVAAICEEVARDPQRMYDLTPKGNMVMIVSDGTAILGLGDLGPEAVYPVLEGKSLLFKKFANVDVMPITIRSRDVDTIVETIVQISDGFGAINLEDIAAPRCFEIEAKLKERLNIPIFHDDQHGTSIVTLAALLNAMKVVGKDKSMKVVVNGAGAAGMAISELLLAYGFSNLIMLDSQGTIYEGRTEAMNEFKRDIATRSNPEKIQGGLAEAMQGADAVIGVSKAGLISEAMVQSMNEKAIVFAMANPEPEIREAEARRAGAAVVATGRSDSQNQVNNVLVFPGLFRGILDAKAQKFSIAMYLSAAEALASMIPHPSAENIIPSAFDEGVAETIAKSVYESAMAEKNSSL